MEGQLREIARECVQKAGAVLLDYHKRLQSLDVRAKGRFDYVTEADLAAQEAIVRLIRRSHPDHDILAEESGAVPNQKASRWLVDPLDGTTNFIHGYPVFAVSVAFEHEGSIILGAVYDPCREELFFAEKGSGATLNDRPIVVSGRQRPAEALIATGFPFRDKAVLSRYLQGFARIFMKVSGMRRAGAAALDLAYVACGRCDGFWELGLSPWDIAAGELMVREAGGTISDFSGGKDHIWVGDVVAGNPALHCFLLGIVQSVFGGNVSKTGG
ncbi:MAG: inositol monophosphatase family protein [Syntrophobacteria bacterium]